MRVPVFAKMVSISLFFSILSLALFLASLHAPKDTVYVYVIYMFIIIVGISFFVAGTITEPVNRLKNGFEGLMKGEIVAVKLDTGDELEELANAFNYTANVLFQQKEELKKSRERYRNLVEEINDWVFELDENLNFTYSSPKVRDILGYEDVMGRSINELLKEEIKLGKNDTRLELEFIARDGRTVFAEVSFKPFFSSSSNLVGYRAVCRDITRKRKAEERMRYLANIVENVVDAVISLDGEGKIVSWNRGAEKTFGFRAKDVVGKHYSILIPKSQRNLWEKKMNEAKESIRFESLGVRVDGTKIQIDVTLTKVAGMYAAIIRDITERKKSEEELRRAYVQLQEKTIELIRSKKELEYLANIVENSSDAIYSVNLAGKITSWNRTAEKMFGWSREEALNMHADSLLPEELKGETELILRKISEGITSMTYETRRVTRNGDIINVEVTISPIYGESKISGFSVIARDVSMKIEAESRILRRVLKYDLERGRVYIVTDSALCVDIVEDFLKCGCNATVISRYLEVKGARNYRISSKKGKNFISPDPKIVEKTIISVPGWNNVVLVELDYLLMENSFDEVLKFVQEIRDTVQLLGKGVVIFTVDPEILEERELRLLYKECNLVRAKPAQQNMPVKCYEILRHVYMQSRVGERVNIAELMDVFKMSRNTVKKYVRRLESMGLVKVMKDGRFKVVVPTQKGMEIFSDGYEFEFV